MVFQTADDLDEVVDRLRTAYAETKGAPPDVKQIGAWRGSIREIKKTGFDYPIIAEYSIFDLERADFLVVGKDKVLTVEAKGWNKIQRVNDYSVEADGGQWQDP